MSGAQDGLPVLVVGAGPVGLALAGDLGWRGRQCLVVEQSDGSIYQPRMDLVGVRTMEFCRRWGLVDAVEHSPYPRDYPQDNVYLTSMTGWELGRERMPAMGAEKSPPQSPQHRERCPQNMFDPILHQFAQSFPTVTLRYRTRLVDFVEDGSGITATIEDLEHGKRATIRAAYLVGCDGASSGVREKLGIAMLGNPALTYTTNIIFRCPNLVALHDKGKAYRHIFVGPEGTWAHDRRDQRRRSVAHVDHRRGRAQGAEHGRYRRGDTPRGRARLRLRDPDRRPLDPARAGGRSATARDGCSWRAIPSTSCRRPAASA